MIWPELTSLRRKLIATFLLVTENNWFHNLRNWRRPLKGERAIGKKGEGTGRERENSLLLPRVFSFPFTPASQVTDFMVVC